MSTANNQPEADSTQLTEPVNFVAWIGIIFFVVAAILYEVLHQMLVRLPATRAELDELRTNAPALTRLLLVGAVAVMTNVVAVVLCLAGIVIPRRSKAVAIVGSILSGLMLMAVVSLILASLLISPK
ncbi:MAG: hypothetical protein JNM43_17925 [Planctomycetaceae bacterium]|nr:hypothetical protein [Planctomycetaceae bacterium]